MATCRGAECFFQKASLQRSQHVRVNIVAERLPLMDLVQLTLQAQEREEFESLEQFLKDHHKAFQLARA